MSIRPTQAGMILGTAAYMAPEQAKGKPADRRADIWAFGVVFFEMLTGSVPFHGETAAEVIASALKEEPNLDLLPRGTPKAICRLIRRCMEKDPKRRLQAIGEARILLTDPLEEDPTNSAPAGGAARVSWGTGWRSWAVAGVLFAIAAATLFVHLRESAPAVTPARFPLFQEGNRSTLSGWEISRDGRAVAYTSDAGGQSHIWIRPLDSLQPRQLPGTEGATYPFWSPDADYLGFFADGKLKKVALAGGPPQILCDAPTGRGGSWNRDGTIVFSPSIAGGIFRVPALGGTPNEVVKNGRFPEFIQGGNRFFFLSNDGTNHAGISVGSLDGSAPTEIFQDPSRAIYVPPAAGERMGHVLYRRGTTLVAQRFDPDRLRVDGNAVPLAERVPQSGNIGYGGFAASETGVLLIAAEETVETRTLAWLNRSGQGIQVKGEPRLYMGFSLSPDGKRLATVLPASEAGAASGGSDIWLQDAGSDSPARFTFGGNLRLPIWSPRGDFLVFATRQLTVSFYRKASNGEGKEQILFQAGYNAYPTDISPDGKWLAYSEEGAKTKDDLWLLPLEGERKPVLFLGSSFTERSAQFSPDGKWMAYVSDESGMFQVYVQPIPATGAKRQVSSKGGANPRWRRDGKELFFLSAENKLMAVPVKWNASGGEFGAPSQVFERTLSSGIRDTFFQPGADGQSFLALLPAMPGAADPPRVIIQMSWQAGLKSRN
jgi:eukaryotic-like serine/threonine-protein kinase